MGRLPPSHVDDPVALGRRIQVLRAERGLSLRQIAFPGCSASFLSRVESGDRVPALVTLRELASRLGVSIEELVGRPLDGTGRVSEAALSEAELAARMGDDDASAAVDRVLDEARAARDSAAESRMLEAHGALALLAGDHDRAIEAFEAARAVSAAATPRSRPGLYESLGNAHASAGDLSRAVALLRVAYEAVSAEPVDAPLAVRFGSALAAVHGEQGSVSEAGRILAEILRHEAGVPDGRARARAEWELVRTYVEAGKPELAQRYSQRVAERLDHMDEQRVLGGALVLHAEILLDDGHAEEALVHLDRADPLMAGLPASARGRLSVERARALARLGQTDEAREAAREALDQTGAAEPAIAGSALTTLAELELSDGNLEEARQLCRESIALVDSAVPAHHLARAYEVLSRVEESAGDLQAALEAARMAADRRALRT
jgi:tetratricopeptide (TPR) repeat protein